MLTRAVFFVFLLCISGVSFGATVSPSTVIAVQKKLTELGYKPGSPDGLFGNNTSSAIKEFQRRKGFDEDGVISDALLVALGINKNTLTKVEKKQASSHFSVGSITFLDFNLTLYPYSKLVKKLKKYPEHSGSTDLFTMYIQSSASLFNFGFDRSKESFSNWSIHDEKIGTGRIEGLIKEVCMDPNKNAIGWFYFLGTSLIKTHLSGGLLGEYPEAIKDIHSFKKTRYRERAANLMVSADSRKNALLVCTSFNYKK